MGKSMMMWILLCKLKAYSFNKNALTFIQSYFRNGHQQTKAGDKFSKWQKILTGVSQDSILGSLFFNISSATSFFLLKLLHYTTNVDDNTMYSSDKNPNIVISRLKHVFAIISEWFYKNYMVLNPEKCHFLTLGFIKPSPDFSFVLKIPSLKTLKKVHKYLNGYIPRFNEWSILFTSKPLQLTQL